MDIESPVNGGGDSVTEKEIRPVITDKKLNKGEGMECNEDYSNEVGSHGKSEVSKQNGIYKACNGDSQKDEDDEAENEITSSPKKSAETYEHKKRLETNMEVDTKHSETDNGEKKNGVPDNSRNGDDNTDRDSVADEKEKNGASKNDKDVGADNQDKMNGNIEECNDKSVNGKQNDTDRKSPTDSLTENSVSGTREGTPDTNTPNTTQNTTRDGTPASERSDTPTTQGAGTEPASGSGTPAPGTPTPPDTDTQKDGPPAPQAKYKLFETCGDDVEDMRPMATILYQLGSNLCKEFVFKDLIHHQEKRKAQNKLDELDAEGHPDLVKLKDQLAEKNDVYSMQTVQCDRCTFKSESENIVEWHKEFAHNQDENLYSCSFCQFETKFPGQFFYHMEAEHNRKGRIFMRPSFFNCPMCPFENSTKAALKKHLLKCEKTFNMKRNLEPAPTDCDIPIKKPKQAPKKLPPSKPLPSKAAAPPSRTAPQPVGPPRMATPPSAQSVNAFQQQFQQMATRMGMPGGITMLPGPTPTYAIGNQVFRMVQQGTQFMLQPVAGGKPQPLPPGFPGLPGALPGAGAMNSNLMNNLSLKAQQNAIANQLKQLQQAQQQAAALAAARLKTPSSGTLPPNKSSTPNNKGPQPKPAHTNNRPSTAPNKKANFEICEICGGFVKDRESLRIHFYWAHKVDIKKEIFEQKEPHLACNVCPQRFWTYQGYRWHQRMKHGNTALPPEGTAAGVAAAAAAQPKPAHQPTKQVPTYFCAVCRSKTIRNLLLHLLKVHRITVDMVCDQKRCPMCGVTFKNPGNTRLHLYNSHKEMFREAPILDPRFQQQQSKPPQKNTGGAPVPTGLFENASKTRTPEPAKVRPGPKSSKPGGMKPVCNICDLTFPDVEMFTRHCSAQHAFPCHRCHTKWSTAEQLSSHFNKEHKYDREKCQLCDDEVTIGRSYIRHMKHSHLNECSLPMSRVKQSIIEEIKARYAREDEEERQKEIEARKARGGAGTGQGSATGLLASANSTRKMGPRCKTRPTEVVILDDESPRKRPTMFPIVPKTSSAPSHHLERRRSPPPPQVVSYRGNDNTYCSTCELEFPDNEELTKHNKEEHGIDPPIPQPIKPVASHDSIDRSFCSTCELEFPDSVELQKHNREEHNIETPDLHHKKQVEESRSSDKHDSEEEDETMEIDGETIVIQKADEDQ